ncbi:hypothetical protein ACLB1S_12500 [Escherichia coli]
MRAVSKLEVTRKKHVPPTSSKRRVVNISRRRNDDKRQAQQEAKALNVEERSVRKPNRKNVYVRFSRVVNSVSSIRKYVAKRSRRSGSRTGG